MKPHKKHKILLLLVVLVIGVSNSALAQDIDWLSKHIQNDSTIVTNCDYEIEKLRKFKSTQLQVGYVRPLGYFDNPVNITKATTIEAYSKRVAKARAEAESRKNIEIDRQKANLLRCTFARKFGKEWDSVNIRYKQMHSIYDYPITRNILIAFLQAPDLGSGRLKLFQVLYEYKKVQENLGYYDRHTSKGREGISDLHCAAKYAAAGLTNEKMTLLIAKTFIEVANKMPDTYIHGVPGTGPKAYQMVTKKESRDSIKKACLSIKLKYQGNRLDSFYETGY